MGQAVRVVDTRLIGAVLLRIEIDRSLTGMGHERFVAGQLHGSASQSRPTEQLAWRLFDSGDVTAVHLFSNMVTLTLVDSSPERIERIGQLVKQLFIHYRPGVLPTAVTP